MKRKISFVLALLLACLTVMGGTNVLATSTKKVTVKVGQNKTVKMKSKIKSVKVSQGKSFLTVKKSGKNLKISGKKAGKAKVVVRMQKSKITVNVTVKAKSGSAASKGKNTNSAAVNKAKENEVPKDETKFSEYPDSIEGITVKYTDADSAYDFKTDTAYVSTKIRIFDMGNFIERICDAMIDSLTKYDMLSYIHDNPKKVKELIERLPGVSVTYKYTKGGDCIDFVVKGSYEYEKDGMTSSSSFERTFGAIITASMDFGF